MSRKVIFLTGKGGVGKTTVSWGTAIACARAGARTAVVGWNPFGDVEAPAWTRRHPVEWIPVETLACFREYTLKLLKFEKVYDVVFDNKVLRTFVRAAPGLPETVVAGKIWDLVDSGLHDLIIVDLPASGHAVTFFQSPLGIRKIFPAGFVHHEAGKIVGLFESRDCRIDLVALPEELPLVECLELKRKLTDLYPFEFGYCHVNGVLPEFSVPEEKEEGALPRDVKEFLARYRAQRASEREALRLLPELHMGTVLVPRFPATEGEAMAERVASAVGAAR